MTPFCPADPIGNGGVTAKAIALACGISEELARDQIRKAIQGEWYKNDLYTVIKREHDTGIWPCPIIHLSIKRNDREPITDWRDMQQIKNELTNPEYDAIELHPKESRLVDTANQYHLWVFASEEFTLPVGWTTRNVIDGEEFIPTAKQRKPGNE